MKCLIDTGIPRDYAYICLSVASPAGRLRPLLIIFAGPPAFCEPIRQTAADGIPEIAIDPENAKKIDTRGKGK